MTLYKLFALIDEDSVKPRIIDNSFVEPYNHTKIHLCFGVDIYTEGYIGDPVFIPWYDCKVTNITPIENSILEVWIDPSTTVQLYREYVEDININGGSKHEPNN